MKKFIGIVPSPYASSSFESRMAHILCGGESFFNHFELDNALDTIRPFYKNLIIVCVCGLIRISANNIVRK